jgi:hypothetical protein
VVRGAGRTDHTKSLYRLSPKLIVSPNNSNEPALKAFQAVAQVALKMEKAGEVNILKKHKSDRFSGGLYDLIILSRR